MTIFFYLKEQEGIFWWFNSPKQYIQNCDFPVLCLLLLNSLDFWRKMNTWKTTLLGGKSLLFIF